MNLEEIHPSSKITLTYDYFFKGKERKSIIEMLFHQLPAYLELCRRCKATNVNVIMRESNTPISVNL